MNKHTVLATVVASLTTVGLSAQDLNPVVEVTNAFEGKMVEAHKPDQKMSVPDSLLKFDLDFDYSVLSNPYKGGYDFAPYLLDMKPASQPYQGKKLYVRAGGGYPFNFNADAVWSPSFKNKALNLNLYAKTDSYYGKYKCMGLKDEELESRTLAPKADELGNKRYKGNDSFWKAGANGSYDWTRARFDFAVAYQGIFTKDQLTKAKNNAAQLSFGFHRKNELSRHFQYDAQITYSYSADDINYQRYVPFFSEEKVVSQDFSLRGSLGEVLDEDCSFMVDFGLDYSAYSEHLDYNSGHFFAMPRFSFGTDRMLISAGVKVDVPMASDLEYDQVRMKRNKGQYVYPDIRFDYRLVQEKLDFFAKATGGVDVNSYQTLREKWHFFNDAVTGYSPLMIQNEIQKLKIEAGFSGNFSTKFRYELSGGYLTSKGTPVDCISITHNLPPVASLAWADMDRVFAKLRYVLDLPSVLFEGSLKYEHSNLVNSGKPGFDVAPFSGDVSLRYNWKKRIYATVRAEGAAARKAKVTNLADSQIAVKIPGYVDLGFEAEYKFNRCLSFGLNAGNLLNQNVQITPIHSRLGPSFTVGICLSL